MVLFVIKLSYNIFIYLFTVIKNEEVFVYFPVLLVQSPLIWHRQPKNVGEIQYQTHLRFNNLFTLFSLSNSLLCSYELPPPPGIFRSAKFIQSTSSHHTILTKEAISFYPFICPQVFQVASSLGASRLIILLRQIIRQAKIRLWSSQLRCRISPSAVASVWQEPTVTTFYPQRDSGKFTDTTVATRQTDALS